MPKAKASILAWHFLSDAGLMRDGRKPRKVETHKGPLILCDSGLHASRDILDALRYAPGVVLCRVRCSGEIEQDNDKLACTRREILWRMDVRNTLREFARLCALRAVRIHAARACEAVGLRDHAAALRALPDGATTARIVAAARAAAGPCSASSSRWGARIAMAAARAAIWNAEESTWSARDASRVVWTVARIAQAAARVARAVKGVARSAARVERPDCRALQGENGAAWEAEHKAQSALLLRMVRMERKIKGARNA